MSAVRQFSARLDAGIVERLERRGLAAGPDVWEVLGAIRATGLEGDDAIRASAEWSSLSVRQVRDAIGYQSEYPAEIGERIRLNEEEADAAEQRWREQSLTFPTQRPWRSTSTCSTTGAVGAVALTG